MAFLNANIPQIGCYVRGNYLRDQMDSFDKKFECLVFGVTSIPGQVPLFNFLMEDGGIWWHAPISAFCHDLNAPDMTLHELELWDSFSYHVAVTKFMVLQNKKMTYTGRSGNQYSGRYLFTLDWAHSDYNEINCGFSEEPDQHKSGHVIALDNGNYAIQPNNRIRVFDPSYTVKKELLIERITNGTVYTVEDNPKWITEDSERYDYKIEENK